MIQEFSEFSQRRTEKPYASKDEREIRFIGPYKKNDNESSKQKNLWC